MGAHHRRPQFLVTHAEVDIVCPGRAIKEDRLRFFCSGPEVWLRLFLLWSSEEAGKASREQKPHRRLVSTEPILLTGSTVSLHSRGYLRNSAAGPSRRRQAGRTGGWESYGSYEAVKSQRQRKIVYWAPGVTSWLVYFSDFFSLFSCFFSVVFFFFSSLLFISARCLLHQLIFQLLFNLLFLHMYTFKK